MDKHYDNERLLPELPEGWIFMSLEYDAEDRVYSFYMDQEGHEAFCCGRGKTPRSAMLDAFVNAERDDVVVPE